MIRYSVLLAFAALSVHPSQADDRTDFDNTEVAPASVHLSYLAEVFTYRGSPVNLDENRKVTILINHGYMCGYSTDRRQPLWTAYRVSNVRSTPDYEQSPEFYDDLRLPAEARTGTAAFGEGFDRGQLAPNLVISKTYGMLALHETFLMSNVSPRMADLNRGLWRQLELRIAENYAPRMDDVWVICGPVFNDDPHTIRRVDLPTAFYMILVDVARAPQDGSLQVLAFRLPQVTPRDAPIDSSLLVSVDQLEQQTNLNFFPRFNAATQRRCEADPAQQVWAVID